VITFRVQRPECARPEMRLGSGDKCLHSVVPPQVILDPRCTGAALERES
jgi:hypothetical protein